MAFTVTARHAAAPTTSAGTSRATNSTTPTADSLILSWFGALHNYITTGLELSTSGGGLTWTDVQELDGTASPLWSGYNGLRHDAGLYRATAPSSPSAFACTFTSTGSSVFAGAAIDITGHNTSSPVVNSAIVGKDNITSGSGISLALGFTPTVGNLVVVAISGANETGGSITAPIAGAGKTFTAAHSQTGAYVHVYVGYRVWDGTESTTITTSSTGSGDGNSVMAAVEIAAESGSSDATVTPSTVAAVASVPAPAVTVSGSANITPATIAAAAAFPEATVSAEGATTTPTVTLKASGFADGDFGAGVNLSETLGAITFAADSLIVVGLGTTPVNWASNQWTVTATGLTFTEAVTSGMAGDFTASTAWFTAPHSAGGSTAITLASSAAQYGTAYAIYEVTGHNTSTPIGATASGAVAADGAVSVTLSASPASTSVVLAAVDQDKDATADGVTVGTGWTEDFEHAAADYVRFQTQRRTGSTSSTVGWDDINPGTVTAYTQTASAVEIRGAGGSSSDATVTPSTVAATAAFPAHTVSVGDTITPATIGATVAFPSATVNTGSSATVTPASIAAVVAIPDSPTSLSAYIDADTIAATTAVPAPTVGTSSGATVTPATIAATADVPAPSLSAGATVTPTSLEATATVPAPTVGAGSSATITPSPIAATVTTPAPTIAAGSTVAAATITAAAAFPTSTTSTGATVTPATITGTSAIPTPSVAVGGSATINASTVAATVTVPSPTVAAQSTATVTPDPIAATVTVPAPSVSGGSDTTITPATIVAVTSFPNVGVSGGTSVNITPAALAAVATVHTPSIAAQMQALILPTTVAALVTVPTPFVSQPSPTPADRTVVVPADPRDINVPAESREVTVA